MGMIMQEDDIFIGSLLEALNLRFARQNPAAGVDGISEIQEIQREFGIFKEGRPLIQSLRVLGVGGLWNAPLKKKWFDLLGWLDKVDSQHPNTSGGQSIVRELIEHLKSENPDPVYFKAHDSRQKDLGQQVIITKGRPIFYVEQDYLVISIPMKPKPTKKQASKKAPKSK